MIQHGLAVWKTLSETKPSILKQKMQKQRLLLPQACFQQGAPICSPQGDPKPALFPHDTLVPVLSHQGAPVPPLFPQTAPVPCRSKGASVSASYCIYIYILLFLLI